MKTPEKALTEWVEDMIWFDWGFERKWWSRREFDILARATAKGDSNALPTFISTKAAEVIKALIREEWCRDRNILEPQRLMRFESLYEVIDWLGRTPENSAKA